jgi:hypothetical protein
MDSSQAQMPTIWQIRRMSPGAQEPSDTHEAFLELQHPSRARLVRSQLSSLPLGPPDRSDDSVMVAVHLLPGAATPFDEQRRAEAWLSGYGCGDGAKLEISLRSTRISWQNGHCTVVAPVEQVEEGLAAAALFTFVERELRQQEALMELSWSALSADADLTHEVSVEKLQHQRHVNAMTAMFQRARIWIARMDVCLQRPSPALGPNGQRLFQELVLLGDLATRLRLLDDAVEVGEDLYERANDRLIEKRNFIIEFCVEVAILLAIVAELVVLILGF